MNAKEATKDAAKHGNPDGIGGETDKQGPDVVEAGAVGGLPKAAAKPPTPQKKKGRPPAYRKRQRARLAKFGPPWKETWSF